MWLLSIYFTDFKWAHAHCTHPFYKWIAKPPPPDSNGSCFAFSVRTNSNSVDVHSEFRSKWDEVGKLKWLDNGLNWMLWRVKFQLKWYNLPLLASFCRISKRDRVMRPFPLHTEIMQTMNTRPLFFVTELVDNGLSITQQNPVHISTMPNNKQHKLHTLKTNMKWISFFWNEIF